MDEKTMNNSERDTHFQGFAKLQWEKIEAYIRNGHGFIPEGETMRAEFLPPLYDLLSECAYDLALHVLEHATNEVPGDFFGWQITYIVDHDIPDLTAWPPKLPASLPEPTPE
jgi:hypothetical protein